MSEFALSHLREGGVTVAAFTRSFNSTRSGQAAMDDLLRAGLATFTGKKLQLTEEGRRMIHELSGTSQPYAVPLSNSRSLMTGLFKVSRPVYREGSEDAFKCPSLVAGKRVPYGVHS